MALHKLMILIWRKTSVLGWKILHFWPKNSAFCGKGRYCIDILVLFINGRFYNRQLSFYFKQDDSLKKIYATCMKPVQNAIVQRYEQRLKGRWYKYFFYLFVSSSIQNFKINQYWTFPVSAHVFSIDVVFCKHHPQSIL